MTSGQRLSYAVLRPAASAVEGEPARVLMIMDTAEEAQSIAAELCRVGIAAEVRTTVGYGPTLTFTG